MKKLLPYTLQILMLAALIFMSVELLSVKKELALIRSSSLSVEVLNTPTVEIEDISPIRVNVDNDPDVHVRP